MDSALIVVPVADVRSRREFICLPKRLYAGQEGYVPPLDMERLEAIDPARNPYFQHAEVNLWLAMRDGVAVGRISAQVCSLAQGKSGAGTGHFGYLDSVDDPHVFEALFGAAESWLMARGMKRAVGPFSFSTNEECGQLVSGFNQPPMLMMPFHLPYHNERIQEQGYKKVKDLLAYVVDEQTYRAVGTNRIIDKLRQDQRVRLRPIDMDKLGRDLALILEIFNDAWSDNWGMIPFTQAEIESAAKAMRPLVDPQLVVIAEVDGEPAGMLVCLPNLLEAISDLDGRLLPFGWLKLFWRLKRKTLRTARIPLMGIRKKHHGTMLGAALLPLMFDRLKAPFLARGLRRVELSWILEDNLPMRRVLEGIGARVYKTYRLYEKPL